MPPEPLPILSYATPTKRRRYFAHLRALPLFWLALTAGVGLAWFWFAASPDFVLGSFNQSVIHAVLSVCFGMECLWSLFAFFVLGCFAKQSRVQQSWPRIFLIALAMPIAFAIPISFMFALINIYPYTPNVQLVCGICELLLCIVPIAAPFLLIRAETASRPPTDPRKISRVSRVQIACLFAFPFILFLWFHLQIFAMEQRCRKIVRWTQSQHFHSGGFYELGPSFQKPSYYGGGPVVELLPSGSTLIEWSIDDRDPNADEYSAERMIYLNAPVLPSQFTRDSQGRPVISISRVLNRYVLHQYSPHLFKIAVPPKQT